MIAAIVVSRSAAISLSAFLSLTVSDSESVYGGRFSHRLLYLLLLGLAVGSVFPERVRHDWASLNYLINYAFPYLIIYSSESLFNCHFQGFIWAFAGPKTGFTPSLFSVRFATFYGNGL